MKQQVVNRWAPFSVNQWIAWLSATVIAAITMTTFLYTNFPTETAFEDHKKNEIQFEELIIQRLNRMEDKLDRSLER